MTTPSAVSYPPPNGGPPSDLGRVADALQDLADRHTRIENLVSAPSAGRLLDINEAAKMLNVSVRTLESHVALGDIAVVRIGAGRGVRRFDPNALDAFVWRQTRRL